MPPARFGLYTLAGCLPWTAALTLLGYAMGANWETAEQAMRGPSYAVAGIDVLAIGIAVVVAVRRRRRAELTGFGTHQVAARAD